MLTHRIRSYLYKINQGNYEEKKHPNIQIRSENKTGHTYHTQENNDSRNLSVINYVCMCKSITN